MEAKLKEYRARRHRKELIENAKTKLQESKEKVFNFFSPNFLNSMTEKKDEELILMAHEDKDYVTDGSESFPEPQLESEEIEEFEALEDEDEAWKKFVIRWAIYLFIWLIFYGLFLYLQFGAVYFVVTGILGIYFNTRTRPRKKGEVSAYSVFNKNCASIDGTLTAEKLQREMMFGAGGIF